MLYAPYGSGVDSVLTHVYIVYARIQYECVIYTYVQYKCVME